VDTREPFNEDEAYQLMIDIALLALVIGLVAMVRVWLTRTPITAPMVFVGAGLLLSPFTTGALDLHLEDESVALLAELTLAFLLFGDATRIDAGVLRQSLVLPGRLLGIGLPLTVALGTLGTSLLLTDLSWAEAALVAAILTPTDAALGEAVVSSPHVPGSVRQALNVESGLNDGLAVPVIAVFLALAAGNEVDGPAVVIGEALREIAIGVGFGAALAAILATLVPKLEDTRWTDLEGLRLLAFATALGAFAGSTALGGNGFLAAFVAGLVARQMLGESIDSHMELVEDVGQVAASATFVVFGALLLWPALEVFSPAVAACAIGTLTLGRMIPVWLATLGVGLKWQTVAFLGWFGPRGLASMVFGLLVLGEPAVEQPDDLFSVVVLVIAGSVLLHGLTAAPLAKRYGQWFRTQSEIHEMPEAMKVPEARMRGER